MRQKVYRTFYWDKVRCDFVKFLLKLLAINFVFLGYLSVCFFSRNKGPQRIHVVVSELKPIGRHAHLTRGGFFGNPAPLSPWQWLASLHPSAAVPETCRSSVLRNRSFAQ